MTDTREAEAYSAFIEASKKFKTPEFDGKVSYGATKFKYATYGELVKCVRKPLLEHGLTIVQSFEYDDNKQFLQTYLQHKNGSYIGDSRILVSMDNKKMQEIGSQITYLKRYSLASLLCLVADDDTDCVEMRNVNVNTTLDEVQIKEIAGLLNGNIAAWNKLKSKFGYDKVSDIHQSKYVTIVNWLKIINQNNGGNNENK